MQISWKVDFVRLLNFEPLAINFVEQPDDANDLSPGYEVQSERHRFLSASIASLIGVHYKKRYINV